MSLKRHLTSVLLPLMLLAAGVIQAEPTNGPLRVCADNPRYFADRDGKAVLLTGSHVWYNLVDMGPEDPPRAFDYRAYLEWMRKLNHNFWITYPDASLHLLHADFKEPLSIPPLDGLLMANALHFVKDGQKARVLEDLSKKLKPAGKIIIIEYNTSRSNYAVPFPLNEDKFLELALQVRLQKPQIVSKAPSSFLGEMYAGIALAP